MAQTVTPLPSIGEVVSGRDVEGRELRISGHPDSDRVVLSIWQDGRCQATVRLARVDVPEVTRALVAALVPGPTPMSGTTSGPHRQPGTVHPLRPGSSIWADATVPLTSQTLRDVTDRISTYLPTPLGTRLRRFTRR